LGLQGAGDAPRVRHEGSTEPTGAPPLAHGGTVYLEPGFTAEAIEGLGARGHRVEPLEDRAAFGGYQAIRRELRRGVYLGASESRKYGHAAGYCRESGEVVGRSGRGAVKSMGGCDSGDYRDRPCPIEM
jgi:gamma-glutamyltranspeptidase/glutathione hydrolase